MAERQSSKPEIASQKRVVKLPPAIGDWTTYHAPKVLVKKVKTGLYGFDRLSKDELNQVLLIHYRFISELLRRLKIDLGIGVEFISCQVEQTTYLNFLRTLSGSIVQGKLAITNLHEATQLFLDLDLSNSIINHALGSRDLEPLNRSLTETENQVLITAVNEYLPKYAQVFENIFAAPTLSIVSSPDVTVDPSINTSSTFVAFSAEISLNDNPSGKIVFGYLGSNLRALLKSYNDKNRQKPLNFARLTTAVLNQILTPVTAVLGKTWLSTSELNLLDVGDVVSLDLTINSPINVAIGNLLKLLAQPGTRNKKNAVRIAGFKEEELHIAPPPLETAEEAAPPAPPEIVKETPVEEIAEEIPEEFPEEEFPTEEFSEEELAEEFPEEEFPTEGTEEEFPKEE
jgi:flagellar motor switch protein FliM